MVYGAMVEKFCARSHGQPVPAARSAAIISMRRAISREGVTFDMSDDPRCPGTRRCYQGGTPPCKLFAVVHAPLPACGEKEQSPVSPDAQQGTSLTIEQNKNIN